MEVKRKEIYSNLLQCKVICKEINGVYFADFTPDIFEQWAPEKWKTGTMRFIPLNSEKLNRFRFSRFVDVDSRIQFMLINNTINKKTDLPNFDFIKINHEVTFDLTKSLDRAKAMIFSFQANVEGSPFCIKNNHDWLIQNIEQVAKSNRARRVLSQNAYDIIQSIPRDEIRDFARLVTVVNRKHNYDMIMDDLEDIAEKNPKLIIQEFKNTERALKTLVKRAVETRVIKQLPDIGYTYNNNSLGYDENAVMQYLSERPAMQQSIHKASMEVIRRSIGADNGEEKLAEGAVKAAKDIAKVPLGDRSISDSEQMKAVQDHGAEKGVDVNAMMQSFKRMLEEVTSPIKDEMQQISEKQKKLDDLYHVPSLDEDEKQALTEQEEKLKKIEEDLENDILWGKSISDWKLKDLQDKCDNMFTKDEVKEFRYSKKEVLFNGLKNLVSEALERNEILA